MTLGSILSALSPYRMNAAPANDDDPSRPIGAELVTEDGRSLPLVGAKLGISAGGGLARAVLEQEFENVSDDVLAVTYKMPLPADGAVSAYAFQIGERTVTGRVDPKATARERFEQALAEGKTAALLEQDKPDLFTQRIGNIPPRARVTAKITVDQRLAWLAEGEWELRFPTVIGPRYVGATETDAQAEAVAIETAPGPLPARVHLEMRVSDAITPGRRVESPSHALLERPDGSVELREPAGARLDRDLVVRWAVAKPSIGVSLEVARPPAGKPNADHAYGLLTIVPPSPEGGTRAGARPGEPARAPARWPRDLVVLLDTSGSMGGTPLALAKTIATQLIGSLGEADRFEVIEFSSSPNAYHAGPLPGTERDKRAVIEWVKNRSARGGTEMHTAVMQALEALRPDAQRQVVLVTDGYIGGEEQIVALLHDRLPASCRLHVVGVGAAPNRALATALARAGRGAEILVSPGEDAERGARRLLDKTRAPVLTDVSIAGDAIVAQAPRHAPDVFEGSPVLAAVQLRPEGGELVVKGKLAHGEWQQRVRVPATAHGEGSPAVVALYARERVADLDVEWCIGRNTEGIDRAVERIGTDFQIATRLTSWVAIDEQKSVDPYAPSRHEIVPQELPYGTSLAGFGLGGAPTGAAPMAPPPPAAGRVRAQRASFASPAPPPSPARLRRRPRLRALSAVLALFAIAALVALIAWLLFAR